MLNPFQIKDLHRSQSQGNPAESTASTYNLLQSFIDNGVEDQSAQLSQSNRDGTVKLSSSDYDEIASTHPRARLTYVDDDDGEVITVGSSLELSQRLNEAIDVPTYPDSIQQPTNAEDAPKSMHIFDIRRSNSVTELWKKFECEPQSPILQRAEVDGTGKSAGDVASRSQEARGGPSDIDHQSTPAATVERSEPLLAAFEAELAKILDASDSANAESHAQNDPSFSAGAQPRTPGSDRPQNPADAFNHAIHNLVDGAQMIHAGVRSRIPDFERQLRDAQRALPEHVGSTLQSALTAMESRARNLTDALHNAAVARGQRSNINFPGEIPMAANTVDGLRSMASELGQMGQTLFAAFENEFGCNAPRDQVQSHGEETSGPSQTERQTQSGPADDSTGSVSEDQQTPPDRSFEEDKESLNKTEEVSSNDQDVRPPGSYRDSGPSTQPQQQSDLPSQAPASNRDEHPGHHRPLVDLPHRMRDSHRPPLFYNRNPLYLPPPRPHPMPLHIAPPPPPFQAGPFWQPSGSGHPWPRYPPNPPPPPPHPQQTWNSDWPPFFGHTYHHNNGVATTASASGTSKNEPAPPTRDSANKTLFIGNVGFGVTEKIIQSVFVAQGFLVDVHLPVDSETKKHAGFGYVNFASIHAAKAALEALQGTHIDGHSVNLEFSDHSLITNIRASRIDGQSTSQANLNNPKTSTASRASKLPESRQPVGVPAEAKQASSAEQGTNKTGEPSSSTEPRNARSETPTLLDRDSENSKVSARYPSLTPEVRAPPSRLDNATSERLPNLSPEFEMSRFPPVSQLDAHMVANQNRDTEPTEGNSGSQAEPQVLFRSSPRGPSDVPELQDQPRQALGHTDRPHRRRSGRLLRRSNTMMPAHPESRLTGPFDPLDSAESRNAAKALRRDVRSLLFNPQDNSFSVRRPGLSDNDSWNIPGSFPAGNKRQAPASNHNQGYPSTINRIDNCVNTLASLGYGSTDEGGHHRLAVYAAAADGKVNDAIEMIEDERKVYAQRR